MKHGFDCHPLRQDMTPGKAIYLGFFFGDSNCRALKRVHGLSGAALVRNWDGSKTRCAAWVVPMQATVQRNRPIAPNPKGQRFAIQCFAIQSAALQRLPIAGLWAAQCASCIPSLQGAFVAADRP